MALGNELPARSTTSGPRWTLCRLRRGVRIGLPVGVFALIVVVSAGLAGLPAGTTLPHATVPAALSSGGAVVSTASPAPTGVVHGGGWSSVEVAFLLETTAYDGVYDAGAGDMGA